MDKPTHNTRQNNQAGFTIIELLIATMVFSVILLIVAFGMLQIGRTYYKGITSTKAQQTSRAISDQISQAIQFSAASVTPTVSGATSGFFCIGDERFSYVIDQQLGLVNDGTNNISKHVLVVDRPLGGCDSSSVSQVLTGNSVQGKELMAPNMRLTKLVVQPVSGSLYNVIIGIIAGDNELLAANHKVCGALKAGTQFCALSELNTFAQKRVVN